MRTNIPETMKNGIWDLCLGRDTEAKLTNLVHKMNKIECSEEKKKSRYIFYGNLKKVLVVKKKGTIFFVISNFSCTVKYNSVF